MILTRAQRLRRKAQLRRARAAWSRLCAERRAARAIERARYRQALFEAGGLVLELIPASEYHSLKLFQRAEGGTLTQAIRALLRRAGAHSDTRETR